MLIISAFFTAYLIFSRLTLWRPPASPYVCFQYFIALLNWNISDLWTCCGASWNGWKPLCSYQVMEFFFQSHFYWHSKVQQSWGDWGAERQKYANGEIHCSVTKSKHVKAKSKAYTVAYTSLYKHTNKQIHTRLLLVLMLWILLLPLIDFWNFLYRIDIHSHH